MKQTHRDEHNIDIDKKKKKYCIEIGSFFKNKKNNSKGNNEDICSI